MNTYFFKIGELTVALRAESSHVAEELFAFSDDVFGMADISVTIDKRPVSRPECDPIIHNDYMRLFELPGGFYMEYPGEPGIAAVYFSPHEHSAMIIPADSSDALISHGAFMALRLILSYLWQKRDLYLMHAASFIYRDRVWLISAKSGTGKSTHADYWKALWPDEITDYNGDLALIKKGDTPLLCGIPWHGTSGIYTNATYPLGGLIMLRRSSLPIPGTAQIEDRLEKNTVFSLPQDESALSVLQRLISPTWHMRQLLLCKDFAVDIVKRVPVWHLSASNDKSSALLMRRVIDQQ